MASPPGRSAPIAIPGSKSNEAAAASIQASQGAASGSGGARESAAPCSWHTSESRERERSRHEDYQPRTSDRGATAQRESPGSSRSGGGPSALRMIGDTSQGGPDVSSLGTEQLTTLNDLQQNFSRRRESLNANLPPETSMSGKVNVAAGVDDSSVVAATAPTMSGPGGGGTGGTIGGGTRGSTSRLLWHDASSSAQARETEIRHGTDLPRLPVDEALDEGTLGVSPPPRSRGVSTTPDGQFNSQDALRQSWGEADNGGISDCVLPRWQPDAEVTYCPICHSQFSFFVRKHHCRKCGRVVCNSCSPHRIIIPHQFIVGPPGSEAPLPSRLALEGFAAGLFDGGDASGGERVRLCNPCVPDPNTAPPLSPPSTATSSSRFPYARLRSNLSDTHGLVQTATRYGAVLAAGRNTDAARHYSSRSRSVTMGSSGHRSTTGSPSNSRVSTTYQPDVQRYFDGGTSGVVPSPSGRRSRRSLADSASLQSRQRALPPPPAVAEEDECPICHRELPSRELVDSERLRESHVDMCVQAHSAYAGSVGGDGDAAARRTRRRTGMYTYAATEKDCVDDAECTICLEEFAVGVAMGRLECLCRFHWACISAWFVNHPGRCPVHQHDGFGY